MHYQNTLQNFPGVFAWLSQLRRGEENKRLTGNECDYRYWDEVWKRRDNCHLVGENHIQGANRQRMSEGVQTRHDATDFVVIIADVMSAIQESVYVTRRLGCDAKVL